MTNSTVVVTEYQICQEIFVNFPNTVSSEKDTDPGIIQILVIMH